MSKKEVVKQQKNKVDKVKRATAPQSPKNISKKTAQSRPLENNKEKSNLVQFPNQTDDNRPRRPKPKKSPPKTEQQKPPKRITHKVARRRRMIKQILATTVSFILMAICVVMSLKLLFIVRTVDVSGSELFSSEDITAFCAIPMESNIFAVDTKELEKRISEEFTYIETVKAQKKLPDKISISITDSVESYYTLSEDRITIYSQSFKVLRNGDSAPSAMLCLNFDMQNTEITDIAVKLLELFKLHEVEGITVLTIADTSDIRAMYEDRLEIKFGTILDIEYKIKMFKKLISENKISTEESGILDATKGGEIVYKRY